MNTSRPARAPMLTDRTTLSRRATPGRRGMVMIEMLMVIILLSTFALVATRLFSASMRVIDEAPAAHDAVSRFEQVARVLRTDVWGASRIEVSAGGSLLTARAGAAPPSQWQFDEDGLITRSRPGELPRHWRLDSQPSRPVFPLLLLS